MATVPPQVLERLASLDLEPSTPRWGAPITGGAMHDGRLQLGLAPPRGDGEARWIGRSLWWIPRALDLRPAWHAIVSSRIGRHPERRGGWFSMLQRAVVEAPRCRAAVLVVEGTAPEPWLAHACRLCCVPVVRLRTAPPSLSLEEWLASLPTSRSEPSDEPVVRISPPIGGRDGLPAPSDHGFPPSGNAPPRRDRAAVGLADRVVALHVRPGGYLESLLLRRIAEERASPGRVRVGMRRGAAEAATRLVGAGAVGWFLNDPPPSRKARPSRQSRGNSQGEPAAILTLEELLDWRREAAHPDAWPYLVHCTRAPDGPWPDQTLRQYRDELVLGCGDDRSGPLAALLRILRQRTVWNSARLVHGQQGVVCWSAVPLDELLARRTYRSHLGRWDYEPYGVAIHRAQLSRIGALPVRYGPAREGANLPPGDRLFFQPAGERVDWTQEREWRVAEAVRLTRLAAESVFVFVPTREEAERVAAISLWPVVITPSRGGDAGVESRRVEP